MLRYDELWWIDELWLCWWKCCMVIDDLEWLINGYIDVGSLIWEIDIKIDDRMMIGECIGGKIVCNVICLINEFENDEVWWKVWYEWQIVTQEGMVCWKLGVWYCFCWMWFEDLEKLVICDFWLKLIFDELCLIIIFAPIFKIC